MATIDFAIFNELSATLAIDSSEATRWLSGLVDVMDRARHLHFRRLRARHDFRQLQITTDFRLEQVIFQLDRDRRNLILSVLSSPYLPDDSHDDRFLSQSVVSVAGQICQNAEGLLSAHVAETLAISFENDTRWSCPEVSLCLQQDIDQQRTTISIPHACHRDHLASHISWASRRTCTERELLPSHDCPLPNTKFSDQLVNGNWSDFYHSTSALGASEKTATLRDMASEVAFVNGYDHSAKLSASNGQIAGALRQVFMSAFTRPGHAFFLSTDFEKAAGAFEL